MKLYYPNATIEPEKKYPALVNIKLFTYDAFISLAEAQKQFFIWANSGYKINHAWIEVMEDGLLTDTIEYYNEEPAEREAK